MPRSDIRGTSEPELCHSLIQILSSRKSPCDERIKLRLTGAESLKAENKKKYRESTRILECTSYALVVGLSFPSSSSPFPAGVFNQKQGPIIRISSGTRLFLYPDGHMSIFPRANRPLPGQFRSAHERILHIKLTSAVSRACIEIYMIYPHCVYP